MSSTTRITVTLPGDQVAELRKLTDNVSGYVADTVARQIRHQGAKAGADLLNGAGLHGCKYAVDATVAEVALRQPKPVAPALAGPVALSAPVPRSGFAACPPSLSFTPVGSAPRHVLGRRDIGSGGKLHG